MSLILVNLLKNQIDEAEGRIPSITNLATTAALNTVENKILHVIYLVKKRLRWKNKRYWE